MLLDGDATFCHPCPDVGLSYIQNYKSHLFKNFIAFSLVQNPNESRVLGGTEGSEQIDSHQAYRELQKPPKTAEIKLVEQAFNMVSLSVPFNNNIIALHEPVYGSGWAYSASLPSPL